MSSTYFLLSDPSEREDARRSSDFPSVIAAPNIVFAAKYMNSALFSDRKSGLATGFVSDLSFKKNNEVSPRG
jgi:hypothetical protein